MSDWLDFYQPEQIAARSKDCENYRLSEEASLQLAADLPWGEEPDSEDFDWRS